MWRISLLLAALGLSACASRGAQTAPSYYDYGAMEESYGDSDSWGGATGDSVRVAQVEMTSVEVSGRFGGRSNRNQGGLASGVMMAQPMAPPMTTPTVTPPQESETATDAQETSAPGEGLLLIYNGTVVLAVYDVEAKQVESIAMIEQLGGFAAERSAYQLTFRVPAGQFREALDQLATLGDVQSVDWNADDVTEEYRDLDIRLQNSMQMRARLEDLLTRAQTVEEALAIEAELERVTLEIERIRGRLRSLEDMIAYSTIVLAFQQNYVAGVPESAYRLPFNWLNSLGLPNLLSLY